MNSTNSKFNTKSNEEPTPLIEQIPWEAMLAYIPVFCIYPWTLRKVKPELAGHVRQGMILFALEIFLFLVTVPVFYKLLWIAVLIIAALGIWAAFNGHEFRLPILADIADKFEPEQKKSDNPHIEPEQYIENS